MRRSSWNREMRLELENYLKQGYTISAIANKIHLTRPTVLEEVKRGLSDEEYSERRYNQYRANKAHLMALFEDVPQEDIKDVLKQLQTEARRL